MPTLARYNTTVVDAQGNALTGATIEVRRELDGGLQPLFSDRDGTIGLSNPFTSPTATIGFHVVGDSYRIKATLGAFEREWRYVSIGTAAELDSEELLDSIDDGLASAIRVIEQEFDVEEQAQARTNMGAAAQEDMLEALRGNVAQSDKSEAWRQQLRDNLGFPRMLVVDEKPKSTTSGASIAGAQTRTLNTVKINDIPGASLSSNQITLPQGTYDVFASAPVYIGQECKINLYSGANVVISGQSGYSTADAQCTLYGRLVVPSGGMVISVVHHIRTARATNGLGVSVTTYGNNTGDSPEIFTIVDIVKVKS